MFLSCSHPGRKATLLNNLYLKCWPKTNLIFTLSVPQLNVKKIFMLTVYTLYTGNMTSFRSYSLYLYSTTKKVELEPWTSNIFNTMSI